VHFDDVWFRYARRAGWALRAVDADVEPGRTVVVLGRNGAGKSTLLQLAAGVLRPVRGAVRNRPAIIGWVPERFPAVHLALFAARHDQGRDINDPEVLAEAVASAGVDPDEVAKLVTSGAPAAALAADHTWAADGSRVFGVPTFVTDRRAVFVRLMSRPATPEDARATLERVLALVEDWDDLNEFKATVIPR